jgi:hypothetical protein
MMSAIMYRVRMLTKMMTAMVMIVLTMAKMIGVREIIIRMTEIINVNKNR